MPSGGDLQTVRNQQADHQFRPAEAGGRGNRLPGRDGRQKEEGVPDGGREKDGGAHGGKADRD